jgi:hypothetical protein
LRILEIVESERVGMEVNWSPNYRIPSFLYASSLIAETRDIDKVDHLSGLDRSYANSCIIFQSLMPKLLSHSDPCLLVRSVVSFLSLQRWGC